MKILHITGKDYFGAGRAAFRLNKALQEIGVDSVMWVSDKKSSDESVHQITNGFFSKLMKKIFVKIEKYQVKVKEPHIMFSNGYWGADVSKLIHKAKPDVVHFHWINRGFIDFKDLRNIGVPIVVTMHDMWYFTGGCHYTTGCYKYVDTCCYCPHLLSSKNGDVSTNIQKYKEKQYNNLSKIAFIGPSTWMTECAQKSSLLRDKNISNIPNCIDLDHFTKSDNSVNKLDQCQKKKILIAAVDVLSDQNKGFKYIDEAVRCLDANEYALVIVGSEGTEQFTDIEMEVINAGYIDNDRVLVDYLSAVDVVVVPSKQENLSNMILESLACEIPVVCFHIGGNDNMVEHQVNGYLAEPYQAEDIAYGINWCTESKERLKALGTEGRKKVEATFAPAIVAEKHVELYKNLMTK